MRRLFKSGRVEAPEQPPQIRAGEALRRARRAMGQEPTDVAAMLRIRLPYLLAIEDGRYDDLPGAAYAAGFLRSYAEYVGLEPEAVVRLYKEEMAGRDVRRELYLPTPAAESRMPGGALLFGALVLAGAVYGGWYYLSATDRSIVDLAPALPDRLVALMEGLPWRPSGDQPAPPVPPVAFTPVVPAPAPIPAVAPPPPPAPAAAPPPPPPPPRPSAAASQLPALTLVSPAPPSSLVAGAHPPAAPAFQPPREEPEEEGEGAQEPTPLTPNVGTLAVAPAAELSSPTADLAAPTGKVYGAQPHAPSRIQLRATQETWVGVKDASGEQIFNRVLKPGEVYRAPDKPGLRVRLGNAGGVVLVIDGVAGPPMGAVGQVLRDVPLDAPSLRATSN